MLHPFFAFLFQADASAPQGGAPTGGPGGQQPPGLMDSLMSMAVPMLLCVVVFWVFMIGPERKQRKKRDEMLKKLGKGDKVMTTGGLYASVVSVQDDVVTLQIADGVRARFSRSAVQTVITDEADAKATAEKLEAEKAMAKR
jgi:preprotein translocase subunit YajC